MARELSGDLQVAIAPIGCGRPRRATDSRKRDLVPSVHSRSRPADPGTARAEYRNGMLRLTAAVAKTAPKKVDVQAA
jgi:hypothetical protein